MGITLNTVFKQVFGEALEPLGFKLIKSKYPYFVRLIGDEIIHIITIRNESTGKPGYKAFNILGGVATVYRQRISLDYNPQENNNWLKGNLGFYSISNQFNYNPTMFDKLYRFSYNEEIMFDVV
ncbi:MAG: hypothetical protein FWG44_07780, partial [Oscillospiraceae bacterium]|nr:hypothetical protein [Oscillospiraceae bacterium]